MRRHGIHLSLGAGAALLVTACFSRGPSGRFQIQRVGDTDQAILTWRIKGAGPDCTISPDIGKVPCEGTANVSAEPVVTYFLTARSNYGKAEFRARLPARDGPGANPTATPLPR